MSIPRGAAGCDGPEANGIVWGAADCQGSTHTAGFLALAEKIGWFSRPAVEIIGIGGVLELDAPTIH